MRIVSEPSEPAPTDMILSIIVPTFNAQDDLPRLLASLSVPPDVEVVFVDDGSADGTVELLEAWCRDYPGARVLPLEHAGPGKARSVGLAAASGRFVSFADSDDEIRVDVLVRGAEAAADTGADVVLFDYETVDSQGESAEVRGADVHFASCGSAQVLLGRAAIWGKVYRRDFLRLRQIDFEPLRSADDVLFSWEVASCRPKTLASDAIAYRYFVHDHGQLTRDPQYFADGVDSLAILLRRMRGRDLHGKGLAGYAWISGTAHVIRKSALGSRLRIARRSGAALVRSFRSTTSERKFEISPHGDGP